MCLRGEAFLLCIALLTAPVQTLGIYITLIGLHVKSLSKSFSGQGLQGLQKERLVQGASPQIAEPEVLSIMR